MRKIAFAILTVIAFAVIADETLYTDNFSRPAWRITGSSTTAGVKNNTLVLPDAEQYFHVVPGPHPFGGKYRFSIEKEDPGTCRLGFLLYPEQGGSKKTVVMGAQVSGKGEFTLELPERLKDIGLIIQGAGRYRNAKLTRLADPAYRLEPSPSYQLVSGKAAPVGFVLFRDNKAVADAQISRKGPDAFHQASGATAHAFIEKGDPSPFDEIARRIRIRDKISILYLGDSLTHFDIGHNHADMTGYFLNKYNPGKVTVWNYACAGDDVGRVIARLNGKAPGRWKNRYHDLWSRNYDWAIVFLGHNDTKASSSSQYQKAFVPPEKQKQLYTRLISALWKKGIKRIILFSSTSSDFRICKRNADKQRKAHNRFGEPKHLEAFNRVLQEVAGECNVEYLDLYTGMKAMPDKASLLKPEDGVHLTHQGHIYVALKTLRYLTGENK